MRENVHATTAIPSPRGRNDLAVSLVSGRDLIAATVPMELFRSMILNLLLLCVRSTYSVRWPARLYELRYDVRPDGHVWRSSAVRAATPRHGNAAGERIFLVRFPSTTPISQRQSSRQRFKMYTRSRLLSYVSKQVLLAVNERPHCALVVARGCFEAESMLAGKRLSLRLAAGCYCVIYLTLSNQLEQ